jgi:hypothetical protein
VALVILRVNTSVTPVIHSIKRVWLRDAISKRIHTVALLISFVISTLTSIIAKTKRIHELSYVMKLRVLSEVQRIVVGQKRLGKST